MSKTKKTIILMIVMTILGYAVGVGIAYATEGAFSPSLFTNIYALIIAGCGLLGGFAWGISMKSKKDKSDKNKGETATGEKMDVETDSSYATPAGIKADPDFISTTWDKLPTVQKTGFPFRYKLEGAHQVEKDGYKTNVGGTYNVSMKYETHALVIGTTGTGKTQIFANPTIRILAHSAEKPSIVMTDPKGELYADNANILRKEGYNVVVLNLDDPYSSSRWNPMEPAFRLYQRAGNLASEVKKFSDCKPSDVGYKTFTPEQLNGVEYGSTWYGFEGKAFPNNEILKKELESRQAQMETEAKAKLRNIAISLIPILPDTKEPSWPQGCQDLITGIMQGMLEDSRNPELGMTIDKFNFYNLYKIAMHRDPGDTILKTMSQYSEGRDPVKSSVKSLMSTICYTSPTTQKSYLGTLGSSLGKTLGDDGILYMTSGTDIDFSKIPEEPTAFFVRIPDHKSERHPLGVLCIEQLYNELVDIANRTIDKKGNAGKLKRQVYFILDEFGNMPPFQSFDKMMNVARSRNIRIEIILQAFKQLDVLYGPEKAKNIIGGFQMQVFLGSEDQDTVQSFSDSCGQVTVYTEEESKSESESEGKKNTTTNKSVQRHRRNLVEKEVLRALPQWNVVVKLFRKPIVKEEMTPFWNTPCMEKNPATAPVVLAKSLDYDKVYYNYERRNQLCVKPRSPFDR